MFKEKEPMNPQGQTRAEFMESNSHIKHLAEICWYFGIYPEELKEELEILLGDRRRREDRVPHQRDLYGL